MGVNGTIIPSRFVQYSRRGGAGDEGAVFIIKNMDKKSLSYLVVVMAVAVMSGVTIWSLMREPTAWHDVSTSIPRRQVSAATDRIFQNDIYNFRLLVPTGWYLHERFDGTAILTKKERQSIPKETEGWAIGEQIDISLEDMATSVGKNPTSEKWIAKNVPEKDVYDQPVKMIWEEINGNRMLRVAQAAAGTDGLSLTYYAFRKNNVYRFALYPFDPANQAPGGNLSDFIRLVGSVAFIDSLETKKN